MAADYSVVVRLYFDYDRQDSFDVIEKVSDRLLAMVREINGYTGNSSVGTGGPCWGPYLEAEFENIDQAKLCEKKALPIIKRFKNSVIY